MVLLIVNVISLVVAVLAIWNATNTDFTHTYLLPSDTPGTLVSQRGIAFWWQTQAVLALRFILIPAAALRIAVPSSVSYRVAHLILSVVLFFYEIIFLVFHVVESASCNAPSGGGSPICNDERWCCVYGPIAPDPPIAQCPILLAPCFPAVTANDLAWRMTFLLSMIISIAFIVLALLHFLFGLIIGSGPRRAASSSSPYAPQVDDNDLEGGGGGGGGLEDETLNRPIDAPYYRPSPSTHIPLPPGQDALDVLVRQVWNQKKD